MEHFAGMDVSVKETSICIVDDTGRIVQEVKVASEPEALLAVLTNPAYRFKRIGLEAGPLSQWLFSALAEAGLPVICVETRHMRAVLKAQINKTDRNDARGIAQMMRVGLYRPVHVKTLRSQKLRMLLTHRKLLQSKAIAIENDLRGTLRNFGLKVGIVGKVKFETRIKELVENLPDLAVLVEPLLIVRRALREQFCILHRRLLAIVRDDEVCRRLMTAPGVGPVVSLTYRATVDVPARFRKSKSVGAVFGLTCARYQSGEVDWSGRISRCGDEMMRVVMRAAGMPMFAALNDLAELRLGFCWDFATRSTAAATSSSRTCAYRSVDLMLLWLRAFCTSLRLPVSRNSLVAKSCRKSWKRKSLTPALARIRRHADLSPLRVERVTLAAHRCPSACCRDPRHR